MTQEAPVVRPAARVILLDADGRILLFRAVMPGEPKREFWITPGGGVHPGETSLEAVRRELWEETGLADAEMGPCVWLRDQTFSFGGRWINQQEHFFVARAPAFDVSTDNHEELERTFLAEHRWWSLAEIAASSERFVPRDFAALVEPLVAGDWPVEPIVVGR